MRPIYFRDFLAKFMAEEGDITKIQFKSSTLTNIYGISQISDGMLRCSRRKKYGKQPEGVSSFTWNEGGAIYHSYVVRKIESVRSESSALLGSSVMLTLERSGS